MPEKTDEKKFGEELKKFKKQTSVENEESTEVYISNFMKSQNQTSRSSENKLQEVYISNPNNTNLSDTEMNDNKSNHIISVDEKRFDSDNHSEDYQAYEIHLVAMLTTDEEMKKNLYRVCRFLAREEIAYRYPIMYEMIRKIFSPDDTNPPEACAMFMPDDETDDEEYAMAA